MKKTYITVLQRLKASRVKIVRMRKKRQVMMKEFRCFYFQDNQNKNKFGQEVSPTEIFNRSFKSVKSTGYQDNCQMSLFNKSELSDPKTYINEKKFFKREDSCESDFSFLEEMYEEESLDKSTKINNIHLVKLDSMKKEKLMQKSQISDPGSWGPSKRNMNSFMVKVTSEKKKLKEKFHFNLNGDKMKKAMKNNLRDGVSKVIHLKKFKKAIYRKILIKKHDVTYATENFCPRNFHNSLHVQLR